MGDPGREDGSPFCGFYCFAGPVAEAANRYMDDFLSVHELPDLKNIRAVDITGAEQKELENHLLEGRPFIFWASLHFEDIGFDPKGGYSLSDGRYHRLFHGLHCMVCRGMDDSFYYLADPLNYNEKVEKETFMRIYRQLGRRAVVFLRRQEDYGA